MIFYIKFSSTKILSIKIDLSCRSNLNLIPKHTNSSPILGINGSQIEQNLYRKTNNDLLVDGHINFSRTSKFEHKKMIFYLNFTTPSNLSTKKDDLLPQLFKNIKFEQKKMIFYLNFSTPSNLSTKKKMYFTSTFQEHQILPTINQNGSEARMFYLSFDVRFGL